MGGGGGPTGAPDGASGCTLVPPGSWRLSALPLPPCALPATKCPSSGRTTQGPSRTHTGHLPVCRGALSPRLQGRGFWRWALSHQASPPSKGQHVVPVPPRGPTTARSWAGLGDRVGDVTEHSGVLWCIIAVSSSCNSCVPPPAPCFSPVATTDTEHSLLEATGSGWVCFCRRWKGKCGTTDTSCSWEKNGVLCDTPAGPPASSQWCWPLCLILSERQVLKRMQRSPALDLGSLQCWWGDGPSHSALRALTWALACASPSRTFC